MWPFKKQFIEWVTDNKKVRRTIHFNNGQEPMVSFIMEYYTRQPHWETAKDYHYNSRAKSRDFEWGPPDSEGFIEIHNNGNIVVVNKAHISKINYEVVS